MSTPNPMNLNQDARFALRRKMNYDDSMRAWGCRWPTGLGMVPFFLYLPFMLVDRLCLVWYLMAMVLPAFGWSVSLSQDAVSIVVVFAWFMHGVFLFGLLAYAGDVLFHVPWGRQFPLVEPPNVEPMRLTWIHFLVVGLVGSISWSSHILHGVAILLEGAVLMYIYFFEPAFGFIPWTSNDEREFERLRYANISNMNTALTPKEPTDATYEVPFKAQRSDKTFAAIHGMAAVKEKLLEPAKLILADRARGSEEPRNGILLHGEPGNGKTVFAQAMAGELNIPIITVTCGPMSSQWLGNMPKVLANTFAYARQAAPCVLFIDEIDSFIRRRDAQGGHAEDMKITNTLLTEIVNLRAHKVILVAATNFLAELDAAAIREGRFDFKVEITPPDEEARVGIVHAGTQRYASQLDIVPGDALSVAKRWNGFSVSRLMAVCKALPDIAKSTGSSRIAHAQWMLALRAVHGRIGKLPGDTKSLSELVLDPQTRAALELIAGRLKDTARIESFGGTLPTGILFHGASGTGKTAAVRALAKEVGWAFLGVAGPDLLADRTKLTKLFVEAKDIRPTIVFIDEADDVLRDRQYSATPDLVNRLLAIMDGAEDKVKDVVWIAATNHPDQIDAALLRAGRFTEKVLFSAPPQDQIPRHIAAWLKQRQVGLEPGVDVFDCARALSGQTIADVEGVMQYALNSAIGRTGPGMRPSIGDSDVAQALRVVLNRG